MKKINSKKLQTALLKGAVLLSGSMATVTAGLFCDSFYGLTVIIMVGACIVSLIMEEIK